MLKDVPIDRLVVDYEPELGDDFDVLKKSITEYGQHQPILVNTNFDVLDGARRIEIARQLGRETIACQVTNDYLRMIQAIGKAYPKGGMTERPLRLHALYRRLMPAGHNWAGAERRKNRVGRIVRVEGVGDERAMRLSHRDRFSEAVKMSEQFLNHLVVYEGYKAKLLAVRPELEPLVLQIEDVLNRPDPDVTGSGARNALEELLHRSLEEGQAFVDRWRSRIEQRGKHPGTGVKKPDPSARAMVEASMNKDSRRVFQATASLSGILQGLTDAPIPNDSPEVMALLAKRLGEVRRAATILARNYRNYEGQQEQ